MAIENVREFEERLRGDEALQTRLRELAKAFEGDRQDERALFEAVVAPAAAEVGLPHTYDEALEYMAQKGDDEDISADEAKAVAAGERANPNWADMCIFLGFGDVNANACAYPEDIGANACAGIGVGMLNS